MQLHNSPLSPCFCSPLQDTTADLGVYYPKLLPFCKVPLASMIAALKWKPPGSLFPGSHSLGGLAVRRLGHACFYSASYF